MTLLIYLTEKYAEQNGISAAQAVSIFRDKNLIDYIRGMYPIYHMDAISNSLKDIGEKAGGV